MLDRIQDKFTKLIATLSLLNIFAIKPIRKITKSNSLKIVVLLFSQRIAIRFLTRYFFGHSLAVNYYVEKRDILTG